MTERKLPVSRHSMMRRRIGGGKLARTKRRLRISYARPSFLEGISRVLDMSGALSQHDIPSLDDLRTGGGRRSGQKEDAEAIKGYWIEVGQYISGAMGRFEAEELSGTKLAKSDE